MSRIKAVFLDFDGVLHLSFNEVIKAHQEAAKKMGLNVPSRTDMALMWGHPWSLAFDKFWPGIDQNAFRKAFAESGFRERHIIPEANQIMSFLKKENYFLALVSNRERWGIEKIAECADFRLEIFDHIQGSDDSAFHKPDPRAFNDVLEKISRRGIDRKAAIYIGDTPLDFQAAIGAGIQFAAVRADPIPVCLLRIAGVPPDRIFNSINDLPDFLEMAGKNTPSVS